jgi:hypothetical protein
MLIVRVARPDDAAARGGPWRNSASPRRSCGSSPGMIVLNGSTGLTAGGPGDQVRSEEIWGVLVNEVRYRRDIP